MAQSGQPQLGHEILRAGFEISCWTYRGFAVVRARPVHARAPSDDALPALPSRSRIVVWGDGGGQIRARLRNATFRARTGAWLRRVPFPSHAAQLEALTDELLAAIGEAHGGDDWAERGGESRVPRAPIQLPGQRSMLVEPAGSQPWGLAVGLVALGSMLILLAGAVLLRNVGSTDATQLPASPVRITEPSEATGGSPDATPAPELGSGADSESDALPASTTDGAPRSTEQPWPDEGDLAADASPSALEAASPDAASATAGYVVQFADALSLIAHRHEVDLDQLLDANALDAASSIYPGQVLRIP